MSSKFNAVIYLLTLLFAALWLIVLFVAVFAGAANIATYASIVFLILLLWVHGRNIPDSIRDLRK